MGYQEVESEIRRRFGDAAFLAADGFGHYAVIVNRIVAGCIVGTGRDYGWHSSPEDALRAAIALSGP